MKSPVSTRLDFNQFKVACFMVVLTFLASIAGALATPDRGYTCASAGCHTTVTGTVTSLLNTAGSKSVASRLDGGSSSALPFYTAKPGDTITFNLRSTPSSFQGNLMAFAVTPGSTST